MKTHLFAAPVATALLLVSGCASVAQTSATAEVASKCKVVMAQPARLNYDPARATDAEKFEARAKLAAIELKRPANRLIASGYDGTIDQALRDCP